MSDLVRLHLLPDSGARLRAAMEPLLEAGPQHGWLTAALRRFYFLPGSPSPNTGS